MWWQWGTEEEAGRFKAHELLEEERRRVPEAPEPRPAPTPRPVPRPVPGAPRLPAFAPSREPRQAAGQPETYGQAVRQAVGQVPSLLEWGRQLVTPGQWPQGVPSFAQPITRAYEDFRQQIARPVSMFTQERIAAPLLGELMRWNVPYRMLAPERAGPSPWAEIPGVAERAIGIGEPLPGLGRLPAFAKERYEEAGAYEETLPGAVRLAGRQVLDPLGIGGAWAASMLTGPLAALYKIVDMTDYTLFLISATPEERKWAAGLIGLGVTARNLPKIRDFVKKVAGAASPGLRRAAQEAGPGVRRFMAEEVGAGEIPGRARPAEVPEPRPRPFGELLQRLDALRRPDESWLLETGRLVPQVEARYVREVVEGLRSGVIREYEAFHYLSQIGMEYDNINAALGIGRVPTAPEGASDLVKEAYTKGLARIREGLTPDDIRLLRRGVARGELEYRQKLNLPGKQMEWVPAMRPPRPEARPGLERAEVAAAPEAPPVRAVGPEVTDAEVEAYLRKYPSEEPARPRRAEEFGPHWQRQSTDLLLRRVSDEVRRGRGTATEAWPIGDVGSYLAGGPIGREFYSIRDVRVAVRRSLKEGADAMVDWRRMPAEGEPLGAEHIQIVLTPAATVESWAEELVHARDWLAGGPAAGFRGLEQKWLGEDVARTEAQRLIPVLLGEAETLEAPVTRPIPPPAEPAVAPAAVPAVPAQPVPAARGIPGPPLAPGAGAAVGPPVGRPVQPPLAAAGVQIAPAGPPAGAVPPVAPPLGVGIAMAPAPGPGRFAEMLPSSEILRLAQRPNNVRRLMDWAEQHPHSPLKWVLQRIGVSGTDPTSQATVLMNTIRADSDAAVMSAVARLRAFGDPEELFEVQDNVAHIAGRAVAIGDLAEGRVPPSVKAALSSEQQAYLAEGWAYFDDLERLAAAEGIDIPKATYGPGEHYWARNVMGRMMPDGTLEVATLRGAPSGRWLTALAGFERPREFDTMHEALANGFRYFSLSDAADMSGRAIYRRIANKRVLDYIIDNIPSRVGKKARYGEVRLPGLKRYFQAEDIQGVKKLLEDSPLTFLEEFGDVMNAVNRVPRTLTTTLDLGPMFAQLYTMLCNWPRQWAKAVGVSFRSAFEPVSFQRFLAQPDHAATVRRFAPYGLITSGSELTAGARRGVLTKIPLVDTAVKTGARIFDNMMTAGRILGLEATEYQAKSADEVSELVGFWNKITGVVEPGAQGISRRQQKLEAAALFAPRLYRATFGVLLDVAQGGLRGRMARNSLAQMAAVTLLGYVGLCGLLKQKARVDPKEGSRWLTVQIGDQYLGIRGALFMTLRMLAQMARDPEDARELAWRYVRGRFSPTVSTAMDVYNRADFIGMPIETPWELTKRVVVDNLTPFWVQGVWESGSKDWKELVAVGGAELAGLRTFPVSPARKRNEIREQLAQATFGKPWASLSRPETYQLEQVPELAQAVEEARELAVERRQPWSLFWADVDSQREPYRIEIAELGQELQAGQRTGRSYREELNKRQMLMARIPETLQRTREYQDIRLEGREPETAVDRFIDAYYKIADETRDPLTGVADARQIVMDREALKTRTPDDVVRQAMGYINRKLDPQYVEARDLYYEYMRIPQYLGLSEDEAHLANEAIRTYRDMRRANPQMHADWTRAYLAKYNPEGYKLMLVAQRRRNPERRRFWAEHPLLSVFYSDLTTEELELVLPEENLWQGQPQVQLPAFAGQVAYGR